MCIIPATQEDEQEDCQIQGQPDLKIWKKKGVQVSGWGLTSMCEEAMGSIPSTVPAPPLKEIELNIRTVTRESWFISQKTA